MIFRLLSHIGNLSGYRIVLYIVFYSLLSSLIEVTIFSNVGNYFVSEGRFLFDYRYLLLVLFARFFISLLLENTISRFVWSHYSDVMKKLVDIRLSNDIWFLRQIRQEYLLRLMTKDIPHVGFVLQAVLSTLTDSILLVIILAYSFYVNVTLTLLMVSIGMALTFFVSKGVRGVSNGATEARKLADEELKGWLIGLYRSFKQLHSLRLMDSFKISLGNVIFERSRAGKRQNFYTQVPRIVVENGVLLLIVVLMSFNSNLSGLLLVMPILIRAVPTTSRLNTSLSTLRFYSKEVTDVYLSLEDVSESNIDYLINTQYSRDMLKVEVFHIRFKGCDNLLQNKELYFVKGVVNFIVGASGTGKTTLVDMVVLDLMKNNSTVSISLIQQDAVMFNLSVFDNINFGRNISTERLKMINTGLGISDDLMNVIQSEGSQAVQLFSGGERQKINLARGLVSEADIYILDEPTNNLDEISKAKLIELLSEIAVESIVIVISHDNEFVSIFEKRKKVNIL